MPQMLVLHLLYKHVVMSAKGRQYQARRRELKLKKLVTEFAFVANIVSAVKVALRVHGASTSRKITGEVAWLRLWLYLTEDLFLTVDSESFEAALGLLFSIAGARGLSVHSRDR